MCRCPVVGAVLRASSSEAAAAELIVTPRRRSERRSACRPARGRRREARADVDAPGLRARDGARRGRRRGAARAQRRPGRRLRRAERAARRRRPPPPPYPTDRRPYFWLQWDLEQPNDADIDVVRPGDYWATRPGNGVNVAVVDQVIHTSHPDLVGRSTPHSATDVVDQRHRVARAPEPVIDHGTHVAGTIVAARDNNVRGIAGHRAAVPASSRSARSTTAARAHSTQVLAWASGTRASTGSRSSWRRSPPTRSTAGRRTVKRRLRRRSSTTSRTRCSSSPRGNEGSNNQRAPGLPVRHAAPRTAAWSRRTSICVGMSDTHDAPDCQSNVGGSVDVFAPGRVAGRPRPARARPRGCAVRHLAGRRGRRRCRRARALVRAAGAGEQLKRRPDRPRRLHGPGCTDL